MLCISDLFRSIEPATPDDSNPRVRYVRYVWWNFLWLSYDFTDKLMHKTYIVWYFIYLYKENIYIYVYKEKKIIEY